MDVYLSETEQRSNVLAAILIDGWMDDFSEALLYF